MNVPRSYADGYGRARELDTALAEAYVRHTTVGDPLADAVVAELARTYRPSDLHGVIQSAISRSGDQPPDTPESLVHFVESTSALPEWFDRDLAMTASRAFLRNPTGIMAALVAGAIIEGFATMISKAFLIRGRIVDNGVRRLKQNLLQLVEQFLPGGIEPHGDGWRLSLRIRLVHAQARMLIKNSADWDMEADGMPISASHVALGTVAFSARLMDHVAALGGDFSPRERHGFIHVWRYAAELLGVPEPIRFTDETSARKLFWIALACEPPTDDHGIILANSIINSAPLVLGDEPGAARRARAAYLYRLSRDLIGDDLADRLMYPPRKVLSISPASLLRKRALLERTLFRAFPPLNSLGAMMNFKTLLSASELDTDEHSFALPTALYDEDSAKW